MSERDVYRMTNMGAGSAKYGPCEVCGGEVGTTHLLSHGRAYRKHDGTLSIYQVGMIFGHKQCLAKYTERGKRGR